MTCIAAVAEGKRVWIGADSAGVADYRITTRADEKVFINGPLLMGFTSSFRMGQLLRYSLVAPKHEAGVSDERYLATAFMDAVRACLRTGGWSTKTNEQEHGGEFIVGYKGRLHVIYSDFQVSTPVLPMAAVGCGAELALGSLWTSRGKKPKERVLAALDAAERFSAAVRRPFRVLEST